MPHYPNLAMRVLLLLALIAAATALGDYKAFDGERPLQSNPNINYELEGHQEKSNSPVPLNDKADIAKADNCNLNAIASASGQALVDMIKRATRECMNQVFEVAGSTARDACNENDMTAVADALYGVAYNYDPQNPEGPKNYPTGILQMTHYLRGCYYAQVQNEKDIGKYSANLITRVRYALDVFLARPNLETKNDAHYEIFADVITLISNAADYINYVSRLSELLTKLATAWNMQTSVFIQRAEQGDVIYAIYDVISRTHSQPDADKFYASHYEVHRSLYDFLYKKSDLAGTKGEWLLRNAAAEIARFIKYSSLRHEVAYYLKDLLKKYTSSNAIKIWGSIVTVLADADKKNCAEWSICNLKEEIQKKILPFTKTCPKTYVDTFIIRAQSISDAEADEVCRLLKDQESYFHNLVKTGWRPVTPDTNDKIEVIIYNDNSEYSTWANLMFGISTNNGGMYLEGNPSVQGNQARYICYEREKNGKFNVWNLAHEFTHYLDGRYDMVGDFTDGTSNLPTIWWIEGFAEYAANKDQYDSMVANAKRKAYSLSTIMNNNYNSGTERIYHYGYLAVRFMFEKHRNDVDTLLGYFRGGKYKEYADWLRGIGTRYDQEFSQWCDCLAQGKSC